jgi:hypothetical protein
MVFVLGKAFELSLMNLGKAKSLPYSVAPFRLVLKSYNIVLRSSSFKSFFTHHWHSEHNKLERVLHFKIEGRLLSLPPNITLC